MNQSINQSGYCSPAKPKTVISCVGEFDFRLIGNYLGLPSRAVHTSRDQESQLKNAKPRAVISLVGELGIVLDPLLTQLFGSSLFQVAWKMLEMH